MEELKSFKIVSRFDSNKIICEGLAKDFKEFCKKNNANLEGANLEGANLEGANLRGANLRGANLEDAKMPIFCKWSVSFICQKEKFEDNTLETVLIKIGCKYPQTIAWWDEWFASDKVFDTPRDTLDFKLIRANYEAMKAYLSIVFS